MTAEKLLSDAEIVALRQDEADSHSDPSPDQESWAAKKKRIVLEDSFEFMARVFPSDDAGCWIASSNGPAACRPHDDHRDESALPMMAPHRWAWMVKHHCTSNPLPGKLFHVKRRCANGNCCNPDHLYLTAPDGHELSTEDAKTWLRTGLARTQNSLGSEIPSPPVSESESASSPSSDQVFSGEHVALRDNETDRHRGADNVSHNNYRPGTWLDAFPWISGVAEVGSPEWWNDRIDDVGTAARRDRLITISQLAMERLTRWKIGQILPGLPADISLGDLPLPTRAINVLFRERCRTAADLAGVTLDSMMDWRQTGIGTVDTILQTLADISMSLATPSVTAGTSPESSLAADGPWMSDEPTWQSSLTSDIKLIADWFTATGVADRPLLGDPLPPGSPSDVVDARKRVESLCASEVLSIEQLGNDAAQMFEDALAHLDARAVDVLRARLFADQPVTLDELGQRHDVTRERIRQIEGKARGALLSYISDVGPLGAIAETARRVIGTICPLDVLVRAIPALGETVESVGQPAWRVLDRLDDAYEIEDGWCVVPTEAAARAVTQTQLQERANKYGVVLLDDLDLLRTDDPDGRREATAGWLAHCGFVVDGESVLIRTQSVGDYGAAVLSLSGAPLSTHEILDRFVIERTAGSLKNAMAIDDRFERVDRDRWALSEWGMESYAGIRTLIREQVSNSGGQISLDVLIEHITGRYNVSASSVISYASSPPFEQRNGVVRLGDESREVRKTPDRTRRLFRRSEAWAYRIRISKEHLRGSGSVAPVAIASVLGLHTGETRQMPSRLGPQSVAWTGPQPSFGTIRRFLMESDTSVGTDTFLILNDNGTFDFELARERSGDPLADALSLVGSPGSTDAGIARAALAVAIGLDTTVPVTSIIGGYRERGDSDIADLLTSIRRTLEPGQGSTTPKIKTEVDDILELL